MSTLIITLPLSAGDATTRYDHVLSPDGQAVAIHAASPAARLPDAGRGTGETVALVPVEALSWQTVTLPKGIGPASPRLRTVLHSLLEDRLLDDPENLHLALEPQATAGNPAWVAVCDKAWLRQHLQILEAAGHTATRIVPEFAPHAESLRLQLLGEPDAAQLVVSGPGVESGVLRLPLNAASIAFALGRDGLPAQSDILAEPAVAALGEQLLQHKIELQQRVQRLLRATQTPWDLAQFDLASTGRTRTLKRLSAIAREVLHAPAWRAARWGFALLILAHLAGLNAWAWKEQADWQTRRHAIQDALTQTFPSVKVVVDAPLQMAREVASLRQATGAASRRDLESMLGAVGSVLPAGKTLSGLDFTAGEARLKGLNLDTDTAASVSARLRPLGYSARTEGDSLLIKEESAP